MPITVPDEYGYVLLSALSTFYVNFYHLALTTRTRIAAKVPYPQCYAEKDVADKDPKAMAFNCAQRAHANYTENLLPQVGELLIAGLRYPIPAAIMGLGWSVSRVIYAHGYVANGPKGRSFGARAAYLFIIPLKLMALYSTVMFVMGK